MEELGVVHQLIVNIAGYDIAFNLEVMLYTWIVIALLLLFGWVSTHRRSIVPGRFQVVGELLVNSIQTLAEDAMGKKLAKTYGPLVTALFMFLVLCNWIGIIPHMEEPTKDLNTPLSMGIMGVAIANYVGIRTKGIKAYVKEYFEPMFFMAPLNIIDQFSKVVSISFRLFGNIMGGSIIILVVSHLTYSLLLPPFLNAFFGLFVGAIQAFVFTMLTIVYISMQAK